MGRGDVWDGDAGTRGRGDVWDGDAGTRGRQKQVRRGREME